MFKHLKSKMDNTTTQDDPDNAPAPVTDDQTPSDTGSAATTDNPDNTSDTTPDPSLDTPVEPDTVIDDDPEIVEIIAESDDISTDGDTTAASAESINSALDAMDIHGPSKALIDFISKEHLSGCLSETRGALESVSDVDTATDMLRVNALAALETHVHDLENKTRQLADTAYAKVMADSNGVMDVLSREHVDGRCSKDAVKRAVTNMSVHMKDLALVAGRGSTLKSSKAALHGNDKTVSDLSTVAVESVTWSDRDLTSELNATLPKACSVMRSLTKTLSVLPKTASLEALSAKATYLSETAQVLKSFMKDFSVATAMSIM